MGLLLCAFLKAAPPNFVIFIADDINFNDFGCTGNPDVQTPRIDALAAAGIRFDNAYLTASSCSVSRNSIMTGRYPHNTGAAELHTQPPINFIAFPQLLKEAGYYTAHSGKFHMGDYANRAFDTIYRSMDDIGTSGMETWAKTVLERPKDKPFFFWLAALDAHRAWGPNTFAGTHKPDTLSVPDIFVDAPDTRKDLAQYYDEIKRFDFHIGMVVEALRNQGVLDNTFILVMADNGRPFPHSKTRVNDRGVKTPFILHWPNEIKTATVSSALISAIDLAPTILDLAGISPLEQFQGRSFQPIIADPSATFRTFAFAEQNWHDYEAHQRMVRHRDFLYILNSRTEQPKLGPADAVGSPTHADLLAARERGTLTAIQAEVFVAPRPREELYDLAFDPEQRINLASHPDYHQELQALRAVLAAWQHQTADTTPDTITRDWYKPVPGYIQTEHHGIRGEMPGSAASAHTVNHPGPF